MRESELKIMPRFLVCTSGKMNSSFTEMVKTERDVGLEQRNRKQKLCFGCVNFEILIRIQVESLSKQLDIKSWDSVGVGSGNLFEKYKIGTCRNMNGI